MYSSSNLCSKRYIARHFAILKVREAPSLAGNAFLVFEYHDNRTIYLLTDDLQIGVVTISTMEPRRDDDDMEDRMLSWRRSVVISQGPP